MLTIYADIRRYATMKVNIGRMKAAADQASDLLKALANRHRLLIVCQLIEGERSVGELADFLNIRASAVSQHLALLRKDGLVQARREGQTVWYAVRSAPARALAGAICRVYCAPAARRSPRLAPQRRRAKRLR